MDRQLIAEARNHSYDGMIAAQHLQDRATTDRERMIADSLYYNYWASYNMLVELEKMEKRKG